jgi:hypothetical protein
VSKTWRDISPSADDVPVMFAWKAADELAMLVDSEDEGFRRQIALKAVSEFASRLIDNKLVGSEPMARQLEAMAGYVRRNMK